MRVRVRWASAKHCEFTEEINKEDFFNYIENLIIKENTDLVVSLASHLLDSETDVSILVYDDYIE